MIFFHTFMTCLSELTADICWDSTDFIAFTFPDDFIVVDSDVSIGLPIRTVSPVSRVRYIFFTLVLPTLAFQLLCLLYTVLLR